MYEQVETGQDGWKIRFLEPNERLLAEAKGWGKQRLRVAGVCTLLTFRRELPNETYFSPSPGQSVHRGRGGSSRARREERGEPDPAGSTSRRGSTCGEKNRRKLRVALFDAAARGRYSRAGHVHDTALHSDDTHPPT